MKIALLYVSWTCRVFLQNFELGFRCKAYCTCTCNSTVSSPSHYFVTHFLHCTIHCTVRNINKEQGLASLPSSNVRILYYVVNRFLKRAVFFFYYKNEENTKRFSSLGRLKKSKFRWKSEISHGKVSVSW